MAGPETPTLEDLREAAEAAWLWDGERGRIVWANRAGVAAFGGRTVFDLIDRPFDSREPGVERIAGFVRSLQRGERRSCLLHFPSISATPLACACRCSGCGGAAPISSETSAVRSPTGAKAAKPADNAPAPNMAAQLQDKILAAAQQ